MRLINVYICPAAPRILFDLLAERPPSHWISHEKLPTWKEHCAFVRSQPFYLWYLLDSGGYVGALEVTEFNEIGIAIFERFQRRGCARRALELFMATHQPLPAIPARRNGRWLSNIACENHGSKQFFRVMGFREIQTTFAL